MASARKSVLRPVNCPSTDCRATAVRLKPVAASLIESRSSCEKKCGTNDCDHNRWASQREIAQPRTTARLTELHSVDRMPGEYIIGYVDYTCSERIESTHRPNRCRGILVFLGGHPAKYQTIVCRECVCAAHAVVELIGAQGDGPSPPIGLHLVDPNEKRRPLHVITCVHM